jgi:hypothetical protein
MCAVALLVPVTAFAQPTLDSLWPNANGLRLEYEFVNTSPTPSEPSFTVSAVLWFDGTVQTFGGTAQVLHGTHNVPAKAHPGAASDPLLAALWHARPDLRAAIVARTSRSLEEVPINWWPLLLHTGYFMKNPTNIQMWQPDWSHPTWTYLTDDLRVGATFTHQLIPELADDVFLHGTVEAIDATVVTLAGTYESAVRMGYVIDYGWTDPVGIIGRSHAETRGHVHFVPGVGPVEMLENFIPYLEIDCTLGACPQEWIDLLGATFTKALSLARVVSVESNTWSAVKSLYR